MLTPKQIAEIQKDHASNDIDHDYLAQAIDIIEKRFEEGAKTQAITQHGGEISLYGIETNKGSYISPKTRSELSKFLRKHGWRLANIITYGSPHLFIKPLEEGD